MAKHMASRGVRTSRNFWTVVLIATLVGALTQGALAETIGGADLEVSLTAAASGGHAPTFVAGESAVYTISVDNLGDSDNTGYTVTFGIPVGTSFASAGVDCEQVDDTTVSCSSDGITVAETPQTFDVTVAIGSGYVIANEGTDPAPNQAVLSATAFLTPPLGRVDSNGNESIDANGDDCHFGLIGQTDDVGLGDPTDGVDILGNDGGTDPCGFGAAAPSDDFNGMIDLNGDKTITGDDSCEDCFFGHDVSDGKVVMDALFMGLSPTLIGGRADLNGSGVDGADDSNAFYGDTSIIDGYLDCNSWTTTANDGGAGDGDITEADDCTLIGYDGSVDGVTIEVLDGVFQAANGPLPTVFNALDPDNPGISDSDFAWSAFSDANDSDTATVDVVGVADLEVTLTAAASGDHSETGFVAGESALYTISVDNLGPSDNAGYGVTFGVPAGTVFSSSSCPDPVAGTVTCSSAGLTAVGAPQTFTVTVGIGSGYVIANEGTDPAPNQADLSATASLASTNTTDDQPGNNSDTEISNVVGIADLAVTSHVAVINDAPSVNPLVSGNFNSLSADVTVTNNGPSDAAGVTVTDTFPVDGIDPLFDETTEESAPPVTLILGSSTDVTFEADVINTLRDGPYASTNTASVDSSITTDDVLGNDSLGDSVDVFTVPDEPFLEDAVGGFGEVGVVWSRGSDGVGDADGGDDIVGYDVILTPPTGPVVVCSRNDDIPNAAGGTKFSHICSGLTNGVTYDVSVVARNGAGASDRSNVIEATPCADCAIEFLTENQRLTMITGSTTPVTDGLGCEALLKSLSMGATTANPIVVCDEYSAADTVGFGGLIANVREDPSVAGGTCGTQACIGGIEYTSNVPFGLLEGTNFVREVVILDNTILSSSANFTFWVDGVAIGNTATSSWCNKKPPALSTGCVEKIVLLTKKTAPNGNLGQGDVMYVVRFNVNPSKGST